MTAYIVAARRSPVCPSGGALKTCSIEDLAAPVIAALLKDADLTPDAVDEVILGNALGAGGNPARRVALAAGLPERVGGLSIDRQCAAGLDAIRLAAAMVGSGQARFVVAGGAESHSNRPVRHHRATGALYEQAPFTPWADRDPDMAEAAASLARNLSISREPADAYAVSSHRKARAAAMHLADEIVQVAGVDTDRFTRRLTPEVAARALVLAGPVTAANMAVAADGAAFCLVAAAGVASEPRARVAAVATLGSDPLEPGLSALPAMDAVLRETGMRVADLASIDLMEAFAVQALATMAAAELVPERVNPSGGALARGHPIGASGAIGAVRALQELRRTGGPVLAAIPAAGGIGSAAIFTLD